MLAWRFYPIRLPLLKLEQLALDNAVHKFARCCRPYPGQEGLVATLSERGVSIHWHECHELSRHGMQFEDLLEVTWDCGITWLQPMGMARRCLRFVLPAI